MLNFPYQKILVVRLSSLGDILLTTPLIRSLKKTNPKLEIHFLLREEYQDVMINNLFLLRLITIKREDSSSKIKDILRQNKYDFVIDLQNNLRSRYLTTGLKCQKFLLVKSKINKLYGTPPIPERYASVIKEFKLDDEGLDLFTNKKPSEKFDGLKNLIGFCPGSRHYTKR